MMISGNYVHKTFDQEYINVIWVAQYCDKKKLLLKMRSIAFAF